MSNLKQTAKGNLKTNESLLYYGSAKLVCKNQGNFHNFYLVSNTNNEVNSLVCLMMHSVTKQGELRIYQLDVQY